MKKIFSLFLLLLSLIANAQPPSQMPDYRVCDFDNDGHANFDLTSQITDILNGLDPATATVTFHETVADAQAGANVIAPINAYVNVTPQSQTLYIRVVDNSDSQIYFSAMTLMAVANNLNAGTDGSTTVCETSTMDINLFSLINGEQPGGTWNWVSGAGGTFNPIAGTYRPAVGATPSVFSYTLVGTAPCGYDSSTATVNVFTQPNAGNDGSITVCNANVSAINLFNLITGAQPGGIWNRTTGTGGTFDAVNGTFAAAAGATSSTFIYTVTGTAPCFSDSSIVTISIIDCNAPPVCGGFFMDSGGADANYANNTNTVTTICPSSSGDRVTVTFSSFNTEPTYDALYVYNGNSISAGALMPSMNAAGNVPGGVPGGFWGNSIPGPFTSSSTDGCLTFRFMSDTTNTLDGWLASVSCSPATCEIPTGLTASGFTDTSFNFSFHAQSASGHRRVCIVPLGSPPNDASSMAVAGQDPTVVLANLTPNNCYSVYVKSVCTPTFQSNWSPPFDVCIPDCSNAGACAESFVLNAFLDTNNNGIKDNGESNFNSGNFVYQLNNSSTNQYGTSNSGAYYIFESNPTNFYDIQFTVNSELSAYFGSSTSYEDVTLPSGSGVHYLYFPVVNTQPYADVAVSLIPSEQPRPGFTYSNIIRYSNNGFLPINGTLSFTKHASISILSISEPGIISTANGFTYNFTNLGPFETRDITVWFQVPTIPSVNLGDLITNVATIDAANDVNLSNNSSMLTQAVVGSYDPNDKMESHGGKIVYSDFTSNDYLYYTIQFENTGTASAEFIRVEDVLDNQLDENTFEMLSSSHAVDTKRVGNSLVWHFYTIDLPTTASNPTGSHGYVSFRIKPKPGYAVGDIIPNTASIYFDYNPAIVTNTFNTEFVQALNNSVFNTENVSLFPNPTSNTVTITNSGTDSISSIAIYELTGKRIYNLKNNGLDNLTLDVSQFAKGMYMVEIQSVNNSKITKKLILK